MRRPSGSDRVVITPDGLLSTSHSAVRGAPIGFPSTTIESRDGSTGLPRDARRRRSRARVPPSPALRPCAATRLPREPARVGSASSRTSLARVRGADGFGFRLAFGGCTRSAIASSSARGSSSRCRSAKCSRKIGVVPYSSGRPSPSARPTTSIRPRSCSVLSTPPTATPRISSISARLIGCRYAMMASVSSAAPRQARRARRKLRTLDGFRVLGARQDLPAAADLHELDAVAVDVVVLPQLVERRLQLGARDVSGRGPRAPRSRSGGRSRRAPPQAASLAASREISTLANGLG